MPEATQHEQLSNDDVPLVTCYTHPHSGPLKVVFLFTTTVPFLVWHVQFNCGFFVNGLVTFWHVQFYYVELA